MISLVLASVNAGTSSQIRCRHKPCSISNVMCRLQDFLLCMLGESATAVVAVWAEQACMLQAKLPELWLGYKSCLKQCAVTDQ